MKSLLLVIAAFLAASCCNDDCAPPDPLVFRVLDDAGIDLIADGGVSPDAIVLQTLAGDKLEVFRVAAGEPHLLSFLTGSADGYAITYDKKITTFTVVYQVEGNDRCCGPRSMISEVYVEGAKAAIESSSVGNAFVIQLK